MKSIRLYTTIVIALLATVGSKAQKSQSDSLNMVSGVVYDAATGSVLDGVSVQAFNDPKYSTMTADNGKFYIRVPKNTSMLYVKISGYNTERVTIKQSGKVMTVYMNSDKFTGKQHSEITLAATNGMDDNNGAALTVETNIENSMNADVRTITRSNTPAIGGLMFIRGINSLYSSTQPLVILDGVMMDIQEDATSMHNGAYNNILSTIDPTDIEKVTVIKNATTLYGSKGANGVILIDTKRSKSMVTRIDAQVYGGMTFEPTTLPVMNSSQYRLYLTDLMGTVSNLKQTSFHFLNDTPYMTDGKITNPYYWTYHNNTDWTDCVYRTAYTQNYKINVQGGDDVAMYYLSLGYTNAESTIKDNDFSRLNIRFNTDVKILQNLKTRFDVSYAHSTRDLRDDGVSSDLTSSPISSPTFLSLIKSPFLSPYIQDANGNFTKTLSSADDFFSEIGTNNSLGNPVSILTNGEDNNKNNVTNNQFNVSVRPELQINKNLVLSELFSYALTRVSQRYFRPQTGMPEYSISETGVSTNLAKSSFSKETELYSDLRLEWNAKHDMSKMKVFGGMRFSSFNFDDNSLSGNNTGNDKTPDISYSLKYRSMNGEESPTKNLAYYLDGDYSYADRYFAQAALTAETSSNFGINASEGMKFLKVRWALFPSLQFGWMASAEPWMKNIMAIDELMLTVGYDETGNDRINTLASRAYFTSVKYLNTATGLQLSNIGNDAIQWETSRRWNIGLRSSLLNHRLNVNLNVYHSHTSNLLTKKTLDDVAGLGSYWCNDGALSNNGFEAEVNGIILNHKKWKSEIGLSMGHYKNEVTKLANTDGTLTVDNKQVRGFTTSVYGDDNVATIIGHPVGVFYGYKTAGVFSTDADAKAAGKNGTYLYQYSSTNAIQQFKAGDVHFVDINGDGIIDSKDKTIIGNPNPDLYGNIHTMLSYKNLSMNVVFNYSLGNDVYNYQRSILESGSNFYNQSTSLCNRWQTEGQVTDIPKVTYNDPMGNSRFSDRWIEDGSYLRLASLKLSYTVPVSLEWLQGLTIWCEGENLFTFTNYLGRDPEFSASNQVLYQGIDTGMLQKSASITFGVKINL